MSQLKLEFPKAKIVSKKAFIVEATITYAVSYYSTDDDNELGFFGSPRIERKFETKLIGVVDNEQDGEVIIERLEPDKHFYLKGWKIEKVVCRLIPITRYELEE